MTKKKKEEVEIKEENISNENDSIDEEQNPKNKTAQMFVDFWDKAGSFHHTNKFWGYPTLFEEYDKEFYFLIQNSNGCCVCTF